MYLTEEYTMYKIAHHLVTEEAYEILHMNTETEELWLEKHENKISKVIRLYHKGFDWKNHLKTDIARVFQRTKAMEKMLLGKTIEVFNIYISSHTPVDDWEDLKRPLQLNEKNPIRMKVFYFTEDNFYEEFGRLQENIDLTLFNQNETSSEYEIELTVKQIQTELSAIIYKKQKEREQVFSFGKPFITYLLIAINVLMFIFLEIKGGSTDTNLLIKYGAKYNLAILDGEWWRIVSSMFIHIGVLHLFMNMLALYYLGTAVEQIFGSKRFFFIYFLAGIGGGLTSFAFSMNISAGASGAIFGLFGALLYFGTIHKKIFLQTMGRGIITIIVINLVIGVMIPNIDMGAHLGGLITGFLASASLSLPRKKNLKMQIMALLVYLALLFGLTAYGIHTTENNVAYQIILVEEAIAKKDFDTVVDITTDAIENTNDEYTAELLFQRSYAYIHLNQVQLAINDLEESVSLKPDYAEAYYNLTLLYIDQGEEEKATQTVQTALRLNPTDEDYIKLYERVTGEEAR